ncbi:MAG: hypothetical protein FJ333_10515, partial [Sphingomonadales bacterium]|nr:hypothetical protein [Sphingomonadales bacterium]
MTRLPLFYKAWDGENCAGPVPRLFSLDPTEAATRLKAFSEASHAAMQLLANKILDVECLNNPQEAMAFLKEGWSPKVRRPLAREWLKQPQPKRRSQDDPHLQPVGDSSGKNNILLNPAGKYGNNIPESLLKIILSSPFFKTHSTSNFSNDSINLVSSSLAKSTWAKYGSVWNNFCKFCDSHNMNSRPPFDISTIRTYVTWCLKTANLKYTSVKSYVSALNFVNSFFVTGKINFLEDRIVSLLIRGAENTSHLFVNKEKQRLTFTLDALLFLGHKIALSDWSESSKQLVWTAACLAFFTSARMGELLPPLANSYDPNTTLCWKNIKFSEN